MLKILCLNFSWFYIFRDDSVANGHVYCHSAINIKYHTDQKGVLAILALFYKTQMENYLMMDTGKYFSSSKKRDLSDNSKEDADPKKPKKQH